MQHIEHLAATIGPRPTGSHAEAEALAYCEQQLQAYGLQPKRHPVYQIRPPRRPVWLMLTTATLFTAGILLLETFPPLIITMLLLNRLVIVPRHRRAMQRPDRQGLTSYNLSAEQPAQDPFGTLIVAAHIDTALAVPYQAHGWRYLAQRFLQFSSMIWVLLLLVVLAGIQYLITGPNPILEAMRWVLRGVVIASYLYTVLRLIETSREAEVYTAGANDNASGVALLMAIADYFATHPLLHVNLRWVLFCANESGLVGSARYVDDLRDTTNLSVLTLDRVGIGEKLLFVPTSHHPRLNEVMAQCGATSQPHFIDASDRRSFEERDIPAIELYAGGDALAGVVQDTTGDTPDHIGPAMMNIAQRTVIQFIERWDNNVSPPC